ncbi:aliphatic sulfonate ABC transporter substrate-binding protein [Acidovorax sp. SUPP2522]|uniref:aliphatic sulfonate ABC transporter substrate-binding protein n=1 Tax=unclassified Acidovorax TaxID=2684926 RepID=UPI00234B60A4|nr:MULTISPECIES: aliphatic sulfonate ABC transporter substrate-binding protein [unclassified Acidovorax]WCM98039.1 aliphatic sulfonate ABC transporter substrate-binding protein [Acidovorax sp. GBBC 1281]GKT16719.1 aliphatic sulfonate ABC transporter substrate-binding protein [Acidovorax sp. SUPP2522]
MQRRTLLSAGAAALAWPLASHTAHAAQPLKELRLDYATYSPSSLVLRRFGWLEESFKQEGTAVKWVFSAGSNRALEYLNAGSIDIGSSAGLAALLSKANGNPIRAPYIFSRPEWTALVVRKDSPIQSVKELKGKKVAATKGTDPYLFLLRALQVAGLKRNDVEIVALQHADGRTALEQGRVDAWAGLDPLMAASELDAGSRLIYRNVAFNTYGFLNVREEFLAQRAAETRRVLAGYERARQWILAHTTEAAKILSEEAKVSLEVALLQLKLRTDLSNPQPSQEHIAALQGAAPLLLSEALVRPGTALNKVVTDLVDTQFARSVTSASAASPA